MNLTDIRYSNPVLKEYILRIDFQDSIKDLIESIPAEVVAYVKSKGYNIINVKPMHEETVRLNKDEIVRNKMPYQDWQFHNGKDNSLIVNHKCLIHSVSTYSSFEDHYNEIIGLWDIISDHYSLEFIKRIGLRYINIIDQPMEYAEVKNFIKKAYIPVMHDLSFSHDVTKMMNVFEIKILCDCILRLNYGFFNQDHPSVIRKYDYIADMDCFYNGLLEINYIKNYLRKFHESIQNIFEDMITPKLRKEMRNGNKA